MTLTFMPETKSVPLFRVMVPLATLPGCNLRAALLPLKRTFTLSAVYALVGLPFKKTVVGSSVAIAVPIFLIVMDMAYWLPVNVGYALVIWSFSYFWIVVLSIGPKAGYNAYRLGRAKIPETTRMIKATGPVGIRRPRAKGIADLTRVTIAPIVAIRNRLKRTLKRLPEEGLG